MTRRGTVCNLLVDMAVTTPLPPDGSARLREYLGVLRLRKWSIAATALTATAAALFFASQQTPMYRSQAKVLATNPIAPVLSGALARPDPSTEQALVGSTAVLKCSGRIIMHPTSDVRSVCSNTALASAPVPNIRQNLTVSVDPDSSILTISYSNPSPARAQAVTQSIASAYVFVRTAQAEESLARQRAPLEAEQAQLNKQVETINAQITRALNGGSTGAFGPLQTQLSAVNQQLQLIQQQLFQLSPARLAPPQIVTEAGRPSSPVSPNKPLIGIVGLILGLGFGVAIAFIREVLDDSLRGRGDLEARLDVPVLAVIPTVEGWKRRGATRLITLELPKSTVSEAYRTLRTGILFAAAQRGLKVLAVCSASAGEGKTTTAANLAVALANAGKRVILVSADLRKPRLHDFFGLRNSVGLASVLAGESEAWGALQDPQIENLRVMSSGPIPARPAELLQSDRMAELLAALRDTSDFVVIDTAPILPVSDALVLSHVVDGVLLVADAGATSRGAVSHSREQLEQVGAPLVGAVLNNFDPSKGKAYQYSYGYYGSYRYGRYGYGDGDAGERQAVPREAARNR